MLTVNVLWKKIGSFCVRSMTVINPYDNCLFIGFVTSSRMTFRVYRKTM